MSAEQLDSIIKHFFGKALDLSELETAINKLPALIAESVIKQKDIIQKEGLSHSFSDKQILEIMKLMLDEQINKLVNQFCIITKDPELWGDLVEPAKAEAPVTDPLISAPEQEQQTETVIVESAKPAEVESVTAVNEPAGQVSDNKPVPKRPRKKSEWIPPVSKDGLIFEMGKPNLIKKLQKFELTSLFELSVFVEKTNLRENGFGPGEIGDLKRFLNANGYQFYNRKDPSTFKWRPKKKKLSKKKLDDKKSNQVSEDLTPGTASSNQVTIVLNKKQGGRGPGRNPSPKTLAKRAKEKAEKEAIAKAHEGKELIYPIDKDPKGLATLNFLSNKELIKLLTEREIHSRKKLLKFSESDLINIGLTEDQIKYIDYGLKITGAKKFAKGEPRYKQDLAIQQ